MAGILSRKPYLTKHEQGIVRKQIEDGQLTIFRLKKCGAEACDNDVPPGKTYCSPECYKKSEEPNGGS